MPNLNNLGLISEAYFTTEVVYAIVIFTIVSCLLNLIFCVCCQMSTKYLRRMAKGGKRTRSIETCLCLRSLADTYKSNRFSYRSGASAARWHRMAMQGSFKLPLTEPTPRRKPCTALTYYPSYNPQQPVLSSDPSQPPADDVIYDDVHLSTIYLNNADTASQQNLAYKGCTPSLTDPLNRGQKCIVDANGMVYLAMGHVSQTPQELRANLTSSRVTLSTFQPESSPKLDQRVRGRRNSSFSSLLTPPTNPLTALVHQRGSNSAVQRPLNTNKSLAGFPPHPSRTGVTTFKTKTPSTPSSLNPPVPFADKSSNDDDFEDLFEMSTHTLLPNNRIGTEHPTSKL